MKSVLLLTLTLSLSLAGVSMTGTAHGATNEELAKEVRAAEVAFAKSMADRDLGAFRKHIAEEAIFYGPDGALRGRDAVVEGWKRFFEGEKAPFSWEPETVDVLESGKLAFSSGPVKDPDGTVIATFNSVWRLAKDGKWRVVFDKGCPVCEDK